MLPNADRAIVPPAKLTGYLLDIDHPDGGPKAVFFRAHGYDEDSAPALAAGLLHIARSQPVADQRTTPYGTSYGVIGVLRTPRGTAVCVRTVWFLRGGTTSPLFVTAYPDR